MSRCEIHVNPALLLRLKNVLSNLSINIESEHVSPDMANTVELTVHGPDGRVECFKLTKIYTKLDYYREINPKVGGV